jgi:hypothetical protein
MMCVCQTKCCRPYLIERLKHVRGGIVAHGIIWMIVRGSIDPWKLMFRIQLSKTCGKLLENDVEK